MTSLTVFLDKFWIILWNMPESLAILIAGILAIGGASLAWCGIQRQIASQENIECDRRTHERQALEKALTAELLCYARSVIEAASLWNERAHRQPAAAIDVLRRFVRPRVYEAVIAKIGLLSEGWPAAAVISFYGNLLELNEIEVERESGFLTTGQNAERVARRLQQMAMNLRDALDGLNSDHLFPIQEVDINQLVAPDGRNIGADASLPTSLQELLMRLGASASQ